MIGQRIRAYRESKGLTQEDLADMVGTSQKTISSWENGQVPNGDMIIRLARALNTSADFILDLTDDPTPSHVPSGNLSPRERAVLAAWRRGDLISAIRQMIGYPYEQDV